MPADVCLECLDNGISGANTLIIIVEITLVSDK